MQICGSGVDGGKVWLCVTRNIKGAAIMQTTNTRKKQRGTPMMSIRLSAQQRELARSVAVKNGQPNTVSAGVHILLAQYAATQAANK